MRVGHGSTDRTNDLIYVQADTLATPHFLHHDDLLLAIALDCERRPAARAESVVAFLDRLLHVLRIVVAPANDHEIFESPSDE